jgi:D-xylose transport system permease protein
MTAAASAPEPETTELESIWTRIGNDFRTGNLGSWPVVIALAVVVLVFSQTAQNFFTPANFTNLITQMAGTCLIAYGVVFVLLIGEIDLSVAFVSGVAGVVVAEAQLPTGLNLPWFICVFLALLAATVIGAFQGSIVALIGVPSFVVTTRSTTSRTTCSATSRAGSWPGSSSSRSAGRSRGRRCRRSSTA